MGCVTKETSKKDTVYNETTDAIEHFYTLFKTATKIKTYCSFEWDLTCQCTIRNLKHLLQNFCRYNFFAESPENKLQ
jgi:hypothetical protein